jgi:hypothetical protein
MRDIVERLRERLTLRYMSDCKCGKCQLVHGDDVAEAAYEIGRLRGLMRMISILDNTTLPTVEALELAINLARAALAEGK